MEGRPRRRIPGTIGNKAQADNFLSELRQAARKGEAFDTDTGLPDSMATTASRERSWLDFCLAYTDMKWPSAAPKTRDSLTDALATLIPACHRAAPDGMDPAIIRDALRHFALQSLKGQHLGLSTAAGIRG